MNQLDRVWPKPDSPRASETVLVSGLNSLPDRLHGADSECLFFISGFIIVNVSDVPTRAPFDLLLTCNKKLHYGMHERRIQSAGG